ncbi:DUF4760 domain-containing protein [Acidicapsa acidisoli]|uniref:DUF4760 domain-containing protein n=1 Tax=Acidicapsa acidisoli TaxID=1615681 RepID=UPI0021DF68B0|nr:hypothetical protein [Acidicapsa acidisoli]
MQQGLATSADGELILKLYELRTEAVMRQARAWITGEFWPTTAEEFFVVLNDFGSQKSCYLRQVVTYWEMAASLVLHGSLSADLFVDCNPEPFFILAKLAHILPAIHEKLPTYFSKTLQLIEISQPAAARYELARKNVAARLEARKAS